MVVVVVVVNCVDKAKTGLYIDSMGVDVDGLRWWGKG